MLNQCLERLLEFLRFYTILTARARSLDCDYLRAFNNVERMLLCNKLKRTRGFNHSLNVFHRVRTLVRPDYC